MKKLTTLLLAAGLMFSAVGTAQSVEFKGKGYWSYSFETATNNKFANTRRGDVNDDAFSAGIRLRLQLEAVASKALSGVVYFEIGDIYYGQAEKNGHPVGGALGADGKIVEVKRAYLDWTVPHTDLKLRMGLQGMKLPLFASSGNFVLDDDAAGIVASYRYNDNFSITGMWARLLNDNEIDPDGSKNAGKTPQYLASGWDMNKDEPDFDALDFYALLFPMRFDGIRVTPWVGFASMGDGIGRNPSRDYNDYFVSTSRKKLTEGMGVYTGEGKRPMMLEYGGGLTSTWWGGLSADLSRFDPFIFKVDFMYGSKQGNGTDGLGSDGNYYYLNDNGARKKVKGRRHFDSNRYDRRGWYVSALAEYRMEYFTPGIFFWYSSGDDGNLNNGSERMPALSGNWEYTHTGFKNTLASGAYDGLLAYQPLGLWGVALQVRDISFIDNLTNHLKVVYMRGTNSPDMPKKIARSQYLLGQADDDGTVPGIEPTGSIGSYLTTNDWALEINLDTEYKIYENLKLVAEAAYLHVGFDSGTWKWTSPDGVKSGRKWLQNPSNSDAFKVGLNFHYTF